ncbi:MAG: bifunctional helix-turn-helix transcriptional regulator/GNAT family N-acetyltransferase [Bacillota bacterium]|nr:bifunctional helix-turn-helix transcriptional regulator/GNAT family N-acetyltransferase [Bacillota bacterium]
MPIRSNFLREIEKIARSLNIIYSKKYIKYGLKRGQYSYLIFINENPGLSQLDLVNSLNIDKTTVAKALKKLEIKKIIFRQKDIDDKRILRTYPTQSGREIYQEVISEENKLLNSLSTTFNEREKRDIRTFLEKISKNIDNEWKSSRNYLYTGLIQKADMNDIASFSNIIDYRIDHYYYIYIYKEKMVGFIELSYDEYKKYDNLNWSLSNPSIFIENLYVLESYRGMGFGYELIKEISKFADELNTKYIKIVIEDKNIPMLKLINLLEFRFVDEYIDEDMQITKYCFEKII